MGTSDGAPLGKYSMGDARSGQVPGSSVDEGLCPSLLLYTSNIYAIIQILMYCNIFHGCE